MSIVTNRARRERKREYLTPKEVNRLLEAAQRPDVTRHVQRDYLLLLLMFHHGLRVSEACQLILADIDLSEKTINIRRSKNGISGRHPLYTGELKALRAWLAIRETMNPNIDTLFVSQERRPLSRATVNLMVSNIAQAAGLAHLAVHPHMLRHSTGYSLVNRGVDIRTVQVHLGHSRIENTVRYSALDHQRLAKLF
jgi:type 1 fimbriae regulatory protein FimB